jgi:Family of unknown function (DUF5683)
LKTFQKIAIIVILLLFCIQQSNYAQDTLAVSKPVRHKFKAEPLRATMLAIAFPGLGQVYNRKFWKIPLVYAGFGAVIYSISFNSKNFNLYMKAYQDFTDAIPDTKSYLKLILADPSTYDPVLFPKTAVPSSTQYYKDGMLRMVDYYKRYRDLSYIGIAAWYLVSILDANVDASLFNYDVTPNLDLTVFPSQVPLPGGFTGAGINLGMRLTF